MFNHMDKPNRLTEQSGSESTEVRILQAARREFVECGLKGARMQSIADRCQVNKALIHYYFRSKERLYQEVFRDIALTMKRALDKHMFSAITVNSDIRSLLRAFVTAYIYTLRDNPDFPRFILREVMTDGEGNMAKVIEMLKLLVENVPQRVNLILSSEMAKGTIKKIDPLHLMLNILGMSIFTFIARPILTEINLQIPLGLQFDEAFFNARIESILDTVLYGITTENYRNEEGV